MPEELMKPFRWNLEKNQQLQIEREINFKTIVSAIEPIWYLIIVAKRVERWYTQAV